MPYVIRQRCGLLDCGSMSDFDNPGQPCPSEWDAEVHGPLFEQVRFYCSFEDRVAAPALFLSDSCGHAGACRFGGCLQSRLDHPKGSAQVGDSLPRQICSQSMPKIY